MIKIVPFIVFIMFITHLSADTFTKDSSNEVVIDNNKKLMWQNDESTKTLFLGWKQADQHCANLVFAKFDDWYLPTIEELESLIDDTADAPAIDKSFLDFFGFFSSERERLNNYYWSSTSDADDDRLAWFVDFHEGNEDVYYKDGFGYVRCVRNIK